MPRHLLAALAAVVILRIPGFGADTGQAKERLVHDAADPTHRGQDEQAVAKYQEAIKEDPANARLFVSLGFAYQSLRRYGEAIGAFENALRLSTSLSEPYYALGLLYEEAAINPELIQGAPEPGSYWIKAKDAWENLLRLDKNPKRKETAKKHLSRISEQLHGQP